MNELERAMNTLANTPTTSRRFAVAFFDTVTNELTQVVVRSSNARAALLTAAPSFYSSRSEEAKAEQLAWLTKLVESAPSMDSLYEALWEHEIVVNILEIPPCL